MARLNRFGFLAIAVVFHLIYIFSIFDIYFVSPIVHGMRAFSVEESSGVKPPASRLVLFVADGLRADKAFQSFPDPSPSRSDALEALKPRPLMPFIRSRVEEHGTFGVSHTRVPTESRPGHVALIAGLYEDVSAVTTGWKLNPVNFDSVFNRSRHTWSWGSPDILPMFKEGAVEGRVSAETYSEEAEDFTQDATHLDTWVFDKVEEMFKSAADDLTLNAALRQDKNVFFLHLLGLDTTGHAYRPYSKEYLHNIQIVDQGVEKMTKLVEDFFGDHETAFVFTADHGMSDWGSHGDGHPDNTRTPLVAWGSGVRKPSISTSGTAYGHEDGFSADWGLDQIPRYDVAQADVAALMAYLAGLDFPVNSVGQLPLPYLAAPLAEQVEAALVNTRGILEMYRVKEQRKRATTLSYKPYAALGDDDHSVAHRFEQISSLKDSGDYGKALNQSDELLHLGLEGLRYLQTYDWLFLRALITVGYLGWIAFAITTVIDLHVLHGKTETTRTVMSTSVFGSVLVVLYSYLWIQSSPATYYAYALFPVFFWEEVFARRGALSAGKTVLLGHLTTNRDYFVFCLKTLAAIGFLEALVFSYFHREVYTALFIAACLWPAFNGKRFQKENKMLIRTWYVGCTIMATFTLQPVVKVESSNLILLGGLLMASVGLLYIVSGKSIIPSPNNGSLTPPRADGLSRSILGIQLGLIVLAMVVTQSSIVSLQAKRGLPVGNQILGWLVLAASISIPFLHSLQPNRHYLHRLLVIFLTFSPAFIILTISYEGLFYFAFSITLITWVRLEHHIYTFHTKNDAAPPSPPAKPKLLDEAFSSISTQLTSSKEKDDIYEYRALNLSDFRIALFFFFLLQSAFFSTGNVAALGQFSLDSVYRLIPVFSPFSQGALLVVKLMIPFALISANLGILNRRLHVAPSSLFMVVMAISDVLTLNFFWLVKDEGSWLDIGTTISHFVIASMLCVFVAILEFVSEIFVSGVEVGDEPSKSPVRIHKSNGQAKKANGIVPQKNIAGNVLKPGLLDITH